MSMAVFNRASAAERSENRREAVWLTKYREQGPPRPVERTARLDRPISVWQVGSHCSPDSVRSFRSPSQGEASATHSLEAISLTYFRLRPRKQLFGGNQGKVSKTMSAITQILNEVLASRLGDSEQKPWFRICVEFDPSWGGGGDDSGQTPNDRNKPTENHKLRLN